MFIIKSGAGYFVKFTPNGTPQMTSDPVVATRMERGKVNLVIPMMNQLGFTAELVKVRIGGYGGL